MTKKTLITLLLLIAAGSIFLIFMNEFKYPEKGLSFNSEAELFTFENKNGFVFLGKFDPKFPATVTKIERSRNFVTFKLKSGQVHNYKGFEGYNLRVVRLENKSGESVYVFRSADN